MATLENRQYFPCFAELPIMDEFLVRCNFALHRLARMHAALAHKPWLRAWHSYWHAIVLALGHARSSILLGASCLPE